MAESTLTLAYADFQAAVSYYLGYGRTVGSLDANQLADVEACIQGGLRMFYNPIDCGLPRHEWWFMRPIGSISLFGAAAITAASWVGNVATITCGVQFLVGSQVTVSGVTPTGYNGTFTIVSSNATQFTFALTSNPGAYTSGGTAGCSDYAFSDDFGGIEGDMTFASADNARLTVAVVSEEVIRRYRQSYLNLVSRPRYVGIQPITTFDGSAGQRFKAVFWPLLDGNYTASFRYRALFNKLTAGNPYPAGGMGHAETIQACMIAYAERHINDTMMGERWAYMLDRMKASINEERTGMTPEFFGYNGDASDEMGGERFARTISVTYKGVQY